MIDKKLLELAKKVLHQVWEGDSNEVPDIFQKYSNSEISLLVLGYLHIDVSKALQLLKHIFSTQLDDGMLPDYLDLTKPDVFSLPIQGVILQKLYEAVADKEKGRAILKELYPKIIHWHRYLYDEKDPEEEGLISIKYPLEMLDWSSQKEGDDEDINGTHLQEPLYNSLLIWSNECLIQLGSIINADISEPLSWHELGIYTFNEKLWNDSIGIYQSFDLNANELTDAITAVGFVPMCGEVPVQEQAEMLLLTLAGDAFGGEVGPNYLCPVFNLQGLDDLGGKTIKLELNWLLCQGLLRYDMKGMAKKIQTHSLEMITKQGFKKWYSSNRDDSLRSDIEEAYAVSAALILDWLAA